MMVQGWSLAEQGQLEDGIAQMHQSQPVQKVYLPLLAEAYGKVGKAEAGVSLVTELLAYAEKTGTRVNEAELYRLKGELTLQQFKVQSSKSKRLRNVFRKRLKLLGNNRPSLSNSALPQASLVSGNNKASAPKLTRCCLKFTTGSLKDLIRRICKRRRRCWKV